MFRSFSFNALTLNTEFSLKTCVVSYYPASCKCCFPSQDEAPLLDYISLICACGWRLFVKHLIILTRAKRFDWWVWTTDKERTLRLCDVSCQFALIFKYLINQSKYFSHRKYFLEKTEIKNCKNFFFFKLGSFCLVKFILGICLNRKPFCIRF